MSAAIAALLVMPGDWRERLDRQAQIGLPNQDPTQSRTEAPAPESLYAGVESERTRHAGSGVNDELTDVGVMASPTEISTSESEGRLTIDIKLPEPAEQPVDVSYITLDLTAKAGRDYVSSHGMLTIRPDAVAVELSIPLIDDGDIEPDETFQLLLSVDSGEAKPSLQIVMATIVDDDRATEHDAAAGLPRLDRGPSETIDIGQGTPAGQPSDSVGPSVSSEHDPRRASPLPALSSNQEMDQAEAALQALVVRDRDRSQPPDPPGSGSLPSEPQAPAVNRTDLPIDARTAPFGRHFRVQIAAVRAEVDAHRAWDRIQADHGPLLTGLKPYVERAETTNGIFYRVQVGPLPTQREAQELCARLSERDVSCFIVNH